MPPFTDLDSQSDHSRQFVFEIVYMSLVVLDLYKCCIIWFHNSTGLATCFNVKVKNLAFDTSKTITNAWFFMKN